MRGFWWGSLLPGCPRRPGWSLAASSPASSPLSPQHCEKSKRTGEWSRERVLVYIRCAPRRQFSTTNQRLVYHLEATERTSELCGDWRLVSGYTFHSVVDGEKHANSLNKVSGEGTRTQLPRERTSKRMLSKRRGSWKACEQTEVPLRAFL